MSEHPLISIIITVLNGEKTLDGCLKSIASQTFQDYELVVVDGGSSDQTVQLLEDSLIRAKTIRVIPGIGLYAGLNAGINESVGQWLYFMGADDEFYDNGTLQEVAEILKTKNNAKVFVGSVACVKQQYILKPMFGSPYWMRHQVHHQGMFYDRDVFSQARYNENRRIASDYEFNLALALQSVPHQVMNIIICNFGGDGVSENQLAQGYKEIQQVHGQLFKGVSRSWVKSYFWLRRKTGSLLRQHKLLMFRTEIKRIFG